MRSRNVDTTNRLQFADQVRQFGSAQKRTGRMRLFKVCGDSIGGIDLAGQPSQRTGGNPQQRMALAKKPVNARKIVKHANIVGHHHRQLGSPGKSFLEVIAVALDGRSDGRRIEAIGAVAYAPPPSPSAERENLPKAVKQQGNMAFVQM